MGMQDQEREALRQSIIEGCREMWDVDLEMAEEWRPLEEEADRILDASNMRSFDDILAPIRLGFKESGMSEEEALDMFQTELKAVREKRYGNQ